MAIAFSLALWFQFDAAGTEVVVIASLPICAVFGSAVRMGYGGGCSVVDDRITRVFSARRRNAFILAINRSMMLPPEYADLRARGLLPFFRSSMHSTHVQ